MQKSLIDTGPIVALFDASDNFHKGIYDFISEYQGSFCTTWPVMTEICYLLEDAGDSRNDFLRWVESGAIQILEIEYSDISQIRIYMAKYKDTPMDLADASLMNMSDKFSINYIVTLDGDFDIYRKKNKKQIKNLVSDLFSRRKKKKGK